MADILTLTAQARTGAGKGPARSVRRAGRVPAVIYGDKQAPLMITLEPRELERELSKPGFFTHLYDVKIDGNAHRVLPRDVQLDPVKDRPLHVDFLRVAPNSMIRVNVPVQFINHGQSPGLKRGGVLNVVRHTVEMICRADAIPDHLTVNLEGHDIGSSIHISMIELPEGSRPAIRDRDFTVATVAAPTIETVPEPTAAEAAATAEGATAEGAAPAEGAAGAEGAAAAGAPAEGAKAETPRQPRGRS
ncbi:MAG TPA: 50S ribosomal protein L25/general stress protein Ctc [Candidatus Sulfotelmatobacter sp.]|nr:50S ribosomal protein L25/general stress protein Ctc [Candidatus Sulfotelmatobacter sp.]